jgi:MerR family Zn(II)-responsive transcriptional regulator of zntA
MAKDYLKIGELAAKADVSADTLRYYEKQGLLEPATRSAAGYRLYSREEIKKIGFIIAAKEVGFTLAEIQKLLSLEVTKDEKSCADVKAFVDHKIDDINHRLDELNKIKRSLTTLSDACCGGPEPATQCTILETLSDAHVDDFRS